MLLQVCNKGATGKGCCEINYEEAIKNITPVLVKNPKKGLGHFVVEWRASQGARRKASLVEMMERKGQAMQLR